MQSVGWKADMGRTAHYMIVYKAERELKSIPHRISDNGRALSTVDNRSGMNREMEQGLADIYGYVPGRTA